MRVVNLARDPYLNHRPVVRVSMLLWVFGGALLLVNGWQYWSHWNGVGRNQGLLQGIESAIQEQETRLREGQAAVAEVDVWTENTKTKYVNALISQRRFPWSALFQGLEEILPRDIKLTGVRPSVRLANDPAKVSQKRPRQRRRSRRGQPPPKPVAPVPAVDKPDEVLLKLSGSARKEEALMDFVDALYQDPSFLKPHLSTEKIDPNVGSSDFSIDVVYLLHREDELGVGEMVAEQEPPLGSEGESDAPVVAESKAGSGSDGETTIAEGLTGERGTQAPREVIEQETRAQQVAESSREVAPERGNRAAPASGEEGRSASAPRGGVATAGRGASAGGVMTVPRGNRGSETTTSEPNRRRTPNTKRETRSPRSTPDEPAPNRQPGGNRSPTTKRPNASDNPRIGGGGGTAEVAAIASAIQSEGVA